MEENGQGPCKPDWGMSASPNTFDRSIHTVEKEKLEREEKFSESRRQICVMIGPKVRGPGAPRKCDDSGRGRTKIVRKNSETQG